MNAALIDHSIELSMAWFVFDDMPRALRGNADVNLRNARSYSSKLLLRNGCKFVDCLCLHQIHRTTPESPSRHAGPIESLYLPRDVDQQVEFLATNFVIISQAEMRVVHQPSEGFHVMHSERCRRRCNPFIFADDMAAATIDRFWQPILTTFQT